MKTLAMMLLLLCIGPVVNSSFGAERKTDVTGFRDLKWGDKATAQKGLIKEKSGETVEYKRQREDLTVLGLKAKKIVYIFKGKNQGLSEVDIEFPFKEGACVEFEEILTKIYGENDNVEGHPSIDFERIGWYKDHGSVNLECTHDGEKNGILVTYDSRGLDKGPQPEAVPLFDYDMKVK